MTKQAQQILQTGIGYRYESYMNSGVRNFTEVVTFETTELGNDDIFLTMCYLYHLKLDLRKHRGILISEITTAVSNYLSIPIELLEAIWVCSDIKGCFKQYGDWSASINNYTTVQFTDKYMLISDLGIDGCLIVYRQGTVLLSEGSNHA